jgi:hypothetical protein
LASVSRDTPLITVIGGRLLRRDAAPARNLPSAEDFRRAVFDKFLDDCETVAQRSPKNVRPLLYLISALQPLALRAENVIASCALFLKWESFEVGQCVDELESSGLLIRSGRKYRVAPDMFADFLLEQASLGRNGTPNGYADAVYDTFGNEYLANLLQNLAELDFRVVDQGQASLLSNVWKDLRLKFGKAERYEKIQLLKSMESAAFYQPGPVMDLVRLTMQPSTPTTEATASADEIYHYSQEDLLNALPTLLRAVAYQPSYRDEAIRRLWELAKADSRHPNSYPRNALSVLKKLAAYSRYKSVSFNLEIAKISQEFCSEPDAFRRNPTPLEVVDALLEREGDEQESIGMTLVLTSFGLNYPVIAPVRELCLQVLKKALHSSDSAEACRAFRSLSTLIHGFLPKYGRALSQEEVKWHSEERKQCLSLLSERLAAGNLPLPLAGQLKATLEEFVALGHNPETNESVRAVLAMLPESPNLAGFDAFCSGDWRIREPLGAERDFMKAIEHNRERVRDAAAVFRKQFARVDDCISELARFYAWARDCSISPDGANEFVHTLCGEPEFLARLAEQIRSNTYSPELAITAQVVLRRLRERGGPDYLATALAAVRSQDLSLVRSAALAMSGVAYGPATDDDLIIVHELAQNPDLYVRRTVVRALSNIGKHPVWGEAAIDRILSFSFGDDKKLADEICDVFVYGIPLDNLSEKQLRRLLQSLAVLPDLDEHGITMVVSWVANNRPVALTQFIGERIEAAVERRSHGDWKYSIVPRYRSQIDLRTLKDSGQLPTMHKAILRHIETNRSMRDDLANLFWQMTVFDEESFDLFRPWLHSGDVSKFDLAVSVLCHAPQSFAVSHQAQVLEILDCANNLEKDCLERTIERLAVSVHPSFFVGHANEEPPTIVNMRSSVEAALADSSLHPVLRRLYTSIKASVSVDRGKSWHLEDDEEF